MTRYFKALATIAAWLLFIWGFILCLVDGFIFPAIKLVPLTVSYIATGLGIASIILGVVAMRFRQKMDWRSERAWPPHNPAG